MSKRILVTGGAGFIGSHTCKELAARGFEPVAFDNLSTGNARAVKWGPLVEADLLDGERLRKTFAEFEPIAIIHFAASAYVGESAENPDKYYRNNVAGLLSLMSAALECGPRSVIFSSSCATYGIPDVLPIDEDAPQDPINVYGRTKLFGEQILRDFGQAYGFQHAILRYFNAAGADPDGEIGEWHNPETHAIPLALMAASGTGAPFRILGNDYDTPDGTCIRDYIHVADLARAHVLALDHLMGGGDSLELNLGTGSGHSVLSILETIGRFTGTTVPFTVEPRRSGDPPILYADARRALKKLGFQPRLSDPDTIIETAAPFFGL